MLQKLARATWPVLPEKSGCFLPNLQNGTWLAFVGVSKGNRTQTPCGEEPIFCSHCLEKCKAQGWNFSWLWSNMLRLMLSRALAANSTYAAYMLSPKLPARLHDWHTCTLRVGLRTSHFVWHCCSTCKSHFYQFCLLHLLLPRLKEVPMLKILIESGSMTVVW